MAMIEARGLTRVYPGGGGIFGVSFSVERGECLGCFGAAGAGKTTLIRLLMGFVRPQQGGCAIDGADCWAFPSYVQTQVGYLPEFPLVWEGMRGVDFLRFYARYRGEHGTGRMGELIERLAVRPELRLRRMPLPMRRKLALIAALMQAPPVLLLDEPLAGLEGEEGAQVAELLRAERQAGRTMLLTSADRSLAELCDRRITLESGLPRTEGGEAPV